MQSIQRSVMVLKPDSAAHMSLKNQAVLKLQSTPNGLAVDLSAASLPIQNVGLYLFDADGTDHFAGDIMEGLLQTTLPDISLQSVTDAAVISCDTLVFYLKSTGSNWTDIVARFKFAHSTPPPAPRMTGQAEKDLSSQSDDTFNELEKEKQNETIEKKEEASSNNSHGCDTCPHVIRQDKINPFPTSFPNSEWVKISYPGPAGWWHYISGKIRSGDTIIAKVLGVPGEYGMAPPIWLEGFGTYMRCVTPDAGGYWLMFQDAETGEVLDMGLSPHGE